MTHKHNDHDNHNHTHDISRHVHQHAPKSFGKVFALAALVNVVFIIIEVVYGIIANSTALIADATHNAGDVLGLLLSWFAYALAQRLPTSHFTYGYRSSTILATLGSGLLFLFATGSLFWEAFTRFQNPVPVEGGIVVVVALIGIGINAFAAWLLSRGGNDLNIKSAFWHLVADALVSAGVVVAGLLIVGTGVMWLDPVATILIALVILWSTWGLFRDTLRLSLHAVPSHINVHEVRASLANIPGVRSVHDLHVWPMSTSDTALTVHLALSPPELQRPDAILTSINALLASRFGIDHTTIQCESEEHAKTCPLEPDSIV